MDFEGLKNGIGVMAEMTYLFWVAVTNAGADEETAINLTSIFLNTLVYYDN